jgi:hypothetical protein
MLDYIWLERLAMDKYSSLLDPFVSYEENKVLAAVPGAAFTRLHFLKSLHIGPIS